MNWTGVILPAGITGVIFGAVGQGLILILFPRLLRRRIRQIRKAHRTSPTYASPGTWTGSCTICLQLLPYHTDDCLSPWAEIDRMSQRLKGEPPPTIP